MGLLTTILKACSPLGEPVQKEISDSYYYTKKGDGIIFSQMGNWFELGKMRIEDADVNTFEVISMYVAKDARNAYYHGTKMDIEVDIPTFRVKPDNLIMNHYPVDKNHVYYFPETDIASILPEADPETFIQTDLSWGMDKDRVYFINKITPLHRNSFEVLNNDFCRDDSTMYAYSYNFGLTPIDAEVSKLQKVDDRLVHDDKFLYAKTPADPSADQDNVVHVIPFEDISSFKRLNEMYFELDLQVFYYGSLLKGIKAPAYEHQEYSYIKSDSLVYYAGQLIEGADAATFEYVARYYSKDKNHVYYMNRIQQGADAKSFHAAENRYYFKDNTKYFDAGKEIEKP